MTTEIPIASRARKGNKRWLIAIGVGLAIVALVCVIWPPISRELRRGMGNGEINFYARVVDENGNPVPGVHVKIELDDVKRKDVGGFMVGSDASLMKELVLTTDAGGNFQVTGEFGAALRINEFEKGGSKFDRRLERQDERRLQFCFGMYRGRQYDNPDTPKRRITYVLVPLR